MKIYFIIFSLIILFINYVSASAQQDVRDVKDFNLYNTQLKLLNSQFVDDTFHIFISLPDDYDNTDKRYPVLYVLDGDISYGIAAGITRYLEIGGNIPELIVIGIGYGAIDKSAGNKRNRDYRPGDNGGAESFQNFINEELIPYIDGNFRTVIKDRTITGYSLGGLFALYSLFTQPGIFNKYVVGSPYLIPENFIIFDYEEQASSTLNDLSAKVFISVGSEASEEKYFNPIDELVSIMQERDYPNLKLETKVFDGSDHLVGPPEVITHGLISVFSE
jgi:predicted alpha/beta superfamily hydrolase